MNAITVMQFISLTLDGMEAATMLTQKYVMRKLPPVQRRAIPAIVVARNAVQ
jgi:hypothetical protein